MNARAAGSEPDSPTSNYGRWSSGAYAGAVAAIGAALPNVYELIVSGKKESIPILAAAAVVAAGLGILGRFLKSLEKKPGTVPNGWSPIKPSESEYVGTENPAHTLTSRLSVKTVNIVSGSSGAGKSTILRRHLPLVATKAGAGCAFLKDYNDLLLSVSSNTRHINPRIMEFYTALLQQKKSNPDAQTSQADLVEMASNLATLIAENEGKRPIYIVFDQFEAAVASALHDPNSAKLYRALLKPLVESGSVFVSVVVRKEWFLETQQLTRMMDLPSEVVIFPERTPLDAPSVLPSSHSSPDNAVQADWIDFYKSENLDETTALLVMQALRERPAGLLQIEARMVYIVLKTLFRGQITRKQFQSAGEIDGLVARYFQTVLQSAPDENVATKILVALISDRRGLRIPKSASQISRIIHEDCDLAIENINHLRELGLVTPVEPDLKSDDAGFVLEHDYIAEFVAISPTLPIKAEDRDNVRTLASFGRTDAAIKQLIPYVEPRRWTLGRVLMAVYALTACCVIAAGIIWPDHLIDTSKFAFERVHAQGSTAMRFWQYVILSAQGYDPIWFKLGRSDAPTYNAIVTITIAAVQLFFMVYVDAFYRGFLHVAGKRGISDEKVLREGNVYKHVLEFAVLVSIYTLFAKQYFLLWPAFGGVIGGLAQIQMSKHPGLSDESRREIGGVGRKGALNILCLGVSMTTLIVGGNYLAIFEIGWAQLAVYCYLFSGILMIAFIVQIWERHTSRESLSRRRAFYDRMVPG